MRNVNFPYSRAVRAVANRDGETYLRRSILVAVDVVERLFRGIDDELRGVVATAIRCQRQLLRMVIAEPTRNPGPS